ncbi:hypothetical protein TD95_001877 [Thielaviopsis punctulata]|uniref:RING-type E3 ubiquitin transferase n=1 Tax=Thielaviopsis punctulata TaxID=72032 RepID=A0A0F4ZFI3_9PEZI|nr:hypothetical protein TD95_001877 [Thielaviopsis punctulata]
MAASNAAPSAPVASPETSTPPAADSTVSAGPASTLSRFSLSRITSSLSSSRPTATTPTLAAVAPASPFPFAAAPDIIRAHQKDAYFQGTLANQLSGLHRLILGARSAHFWAAETRTAASLLYLALTTLLGNRTLGEEYCDVVPLHGTSGRLPSLRRRAVYIASSVLLPYALTKSMPALRTRARAFIVRHLARAAPRSAEARLWRYLGTHLSTLLSTAPTHAVTLALFYFSGTYYEVAKRVLGLRYVFTHKVAATPDRAGYEVLGVLLVVQMAVTAWLHTRQLVTGAGGDPDAEAALAAEVREEQVRNGAASVSLGDTAFHAPADLTDILLGTANTSTSTGAAAALDATQALQSPAAGASSASSKVDISAVTHTPVLATPHYDLEDEATMAYIVGMQQRKCTLCLEALRDPAATQCGHVFCWTCIADWVKEKPECPLCRREALVQHILPLRTV